MNSLKGCFIFRILHDILWIIRGDLFILSEQNYKWDFKLRFFPSKPEDNERPDRLIHQRWNCFLN